MRTEGHHVLQGHQRTGAHLKALGLSLRRPLQAQGLLVRGLVHQHGAALVQGGLVGVVLAMVFWLLKQFFESTMKQQAALVASMTAIQESSAKTALMVADLQARMVTHMERDEDTDKAILTAIQRCGVGGGKS